MSDVSQGPGWWLASDGKWYPPQQAAPQPTTPPTSVLGGAGGPPAPGWWLASDGKWYPPEQFTGPSPAAPLAAAKAMPYGAAPAVGGPPPKGYWQAPDGQWYPPQPKKKIYTRVWFWLLVVVALGFGGCVALIAGGTAAVNHAAHVNHTIVYSVTGSGQANDITYDTLQEGNGQNGTAQETDVNLPWTKTINASGLFTVFDVTATVGSSGGSLTCTITEDGKQIATNSASGAFASADCTAAGTG